MRVRSDPGDLNPGHRQAAEEENHEASQPDSSPGFDGEENGGHYQFLVLF
jgi:hypothetical protein